MRGFLRYSTSLLLTLILVGCAAPPLIRKEPDPFQVFPQKYRMLATEWERKGEFRKALFSWRVVISFIPNDMEASERIKALQEQMRNEADRHFSVGLDHFQKHSIQSARKEFLIALAYNPDHEQALKYLKYQLTEPDYISYQANEGDTLRRIAEEAYHDPEKEFLIAYFNDLDIRNTLKSGKMLKLPMLEALSTSRPPPSEEMLSKARALFKAREYQKLSTSRPPPCEERLSKARKLFKAREYQKALAIVKRILECAPSNREAIDLRNASYYELGTVYLGQKDCLKSLKMFKNVDITFRDVSERMGYLKKQIKDLAEIHYKKGVTYFLAENLEKSAEEWEKTLQFDPEHTKAKRDLEKTLHLLDKLRKIQ